VPSDTMQRVLIRSGYDFQHGFEMLLNKRRESVSGATIYASVISEDKSSELIADKAQSSSATGADWANGIVTIEFAAADTSALTPQNCWIELAVTMSGKRLPYDHIPARIEKGWTTT